MATFSEIISNGCRHRVERTPSRQVELESSNFNIRCCSTGPWCLNGRCAFCARRSGDGRSARGISSAPNARPSRAFRRSASGQRLHDVVDDIARLVEVIFLHQFADLDHKRGGIIVADLRLQLREGNRAATLLGRKPLARKADEFKVARRRRCSCRHQAPSSASDIAPGALAQDRRAHGQCEILMKLSCDWKSQPYRPQQEQALALPVRSTWMGGHGTEP